MLLVSDTAVCSAIEPRRHEHASAYAEDLLTEKHASTDGWFNNSAKRYRGKAPLFTHLPRALFNREFGAIGSYKPLSPGPVSLADRGEARSTDRLQATTRNTSSNNKYGHLPVPDLETHKRAHPRTASPPLLCPAREARDPFWVLAT